jgi:hypothetical protein
VNISENEIKFQVVMLVVEAAAFLGLAAWCLSRRREGRWALVGAVGAALTGLGLGIFASTSVEGWFFESAHLAEFFFVDHAHLDTGLYVGRAAGALLLVTAFVLRRRTTAAPRDGSIYGP